MAATLTPPSSSSLSTTSSEHHWSTTIVVSPPPQSYRRCPATFVTTTLFITTFITTAALPSSPYPSHCDHHVIIATPTLRPVRVRLAQKLKRERLLCCLTTSKGAFGTAALNEENGNSFNPVPRIVANADGTSSSTIPEQIHRVDLEEIDLKWQLALLGMRARRYFQRTGKKITINGSDTAGYDKTKVLIRATWLMLKLQPTWLLWLSQTQRDSSFKDSKINALNLQMERLRKEKESNQIKIDNFENASKSLVKWIESQISDNSRKVLRFASYNAFAPPPIGLFAPPTIDLSNSGLEEFQHPKFKGYGPKATVLTKSGIVPISTARQNSSRAVSPVSVARPINTDAPKPLVNVAKPRQNALHK
nr:ribonuclease H-like domain-containing protein [Tanacetum cinerariifolium]GEY74853.1 ribonuclease H-like domain-containing protein [Tanacetum cinerariifolium]